MYALVIIVTIVPAVMIVGAILAPALAHRRLPPFRDRPLQEGDRSEEARAGNQGIPVPARGSGLDLGNPNVYPPESSQEDQYFEDWMSLQERFVD